MSEIADELENVSEEITQNAAQKDTGVKYDRRVKKEAK